jgi:DNA helicase HerA-like ATPase
MSSFHEDMASGYATDERTVGIGRPFLGEQPPLTDVEVGIPVRLLNRHGLICGATGTGKTKTLQLLAERISAQGSPVFAADLKGDVAGLGAPGEPVAPVVERDEQLSAGWEAAAAPVELLSLTEDGGVPIRASVSGFGPDLLSKVLGLNETQESSLSLVFQFCDEHELPLIELEDLRAALAYLVGPGKEQLEQIGGVSKATIGVIQRELAQLEGDGGDVFFGEPEFDVLDLLRTTDDGRGVVSVLDLTGVDDRPALFSTFLMWLLAELFEQLPEVGDPEQPELVFFFDEAHLLFDGASKAFIDSVTRTARLIRSKGVGVFFVTQLATDVHEDVLSQLGHRIQHAVRAFTPKDAKALKATVETFPLTDHYDLPELMQSLGVGEAAVTVLDEDGVPTPVAATRIYPPQSRMDPLSGPERDAIIDASPLIDLYDERVDRESAEEILAARMEHERERARHIAEEKAAERRDQRGPRSQRSRSSGSRRRRRRSDSDLAGQVGDFLSSREGKRLGKKVMRGIFGMLK